MPDKPEKSASKLLSSRKTLVMATAEKNGAPSELCAVRAPRAAPLRVHELPFTPHNKYVGNGERRASC